MFNARRKIVFGCVFGCLLGGPVVFLPGCGEDKAASDAPKLDAEQQKAIADQQKATQEFYAKKKK